MDKGENGLKIFSFINVFSRLVPQALYNVGLNHKLINPFPNKPWFLHVCSTSLLKTVQQNMPSENTAGKGEIARYEQFLIFQQCFPPF